MNKGFTIIELIATLLIISILSVIAMSRIIDFEGSAERRLLGAVLDEMNAREHMAYLDCKMANCGEYQMPDFSDLQGATLLGTSSIKFDGGGTYSVYRYETEFAYRWSDKIPQSTEITPEEPPAEPPAEDQCPPGYSPDKNGKCKKDKKK